MFTRENERNVPRELQLAAHKYHGISVASEYTNHSFPGLNLGFDLGNAFLYTTHVDNVFITHGHADHAGGVVSHMWRRYGWNLPVANYYASTETAELLNDVIEASCRLSRSDSVGRRVRALNPGDVVQVGRVTVEPFTVFHRIPCQGYLVRSKRSKLLEKYKKLDTRSVRELVLSGEPVSEVIFHPEIAFCGDTNIKILTTKPELLETRVLILECTGIDDTMDPDGVYRKGHTHLQHVVEAAKTMEFKNEVLVLTHFSARYHWSQIQNVLQQLPDYLRQKTVVV